MALQNKKKEIRHGDLIKDNAEFFWGWATPAGKLRAKRRAQIITKEIGDKKLSRVLEIGCGTGVFTDFFSQTNADIYSIDISFSLLKKSLIKLAGSKVNLCAADIENLPYHDESFDAVLGISVLHHLNINPTLKEIKRVLKKDGVIIFSEPNMLNPQLMLQKNIKLLKKILGETEDETAFLKWKIRSLLKGQGFTKIHITPFDFLHPWTPSFLINYVEKIGYCLEKVPFLREIAGSLLIYAIK